MSKATSFITSSPEPCGPKGQLRRTAMPTNQITRRALFQATASAACGAVSSCRHSSFAGAQRPKFNAVIDTAWEAGLATLKPSPLELERGLKLHAESLVFDCYGFSPRCAVDGDRIAKAVAAGALTSEVQDMQEDMGMTRCVTVPRSGRSSNSAGKRRASLAFFRTPARKDRTRCGC